jgi:Phage protein Gp138 N-terminal domain
MTVLSPPSRNPTDNHSLQGVFNVVLRKFLQKTDDMLPAKVISYNQASNMAQVQPLINIVLTNGTVVNRAPIQSVPVLRLGAGGVIFNLSPAPNDLGWIKANDRDISIFLQTYSASIPNTGRFHSFSDAVFIPDVMNHSVTVNSSHAGDATIQTKDGTSSVGLMANNCVLDCVSTTKAFGLPAMTTSQKNAIPSPRAGMMVWDTTENGVSTYNGTRWS